MESNEGAASRQPRASLMRKLIHLAMAILPLVGWWIAYWLVLALAAAMLGASLIVEVARRWWPWLNRLLWRLLPTVFREAEGHRVLGSTWFAVGALVTASKRQPVDACSFRIGNRYGSRADRRRDCTATSVALNWWKTRWRGG